MGIIREHGYSATVTAYFEANGQRVQIAKTSHKDFFVAELCEFAPRTVGTLVITVDERIKSQQVELPNGIPYGESCAVYRVLAPL